MKKYMYIILVSICCFMLVACGSSENHDGEAKTPSGSTIMKGDDYKSVVEEFEENGFTNIKLEKIEDLIIGWLTKEGEVEEVSVGGDVDYSPDKWVPADTEVIIKYHAFPEKKDKTEEPKSNDNIEPEGVDEDNSQDGTEDKGESKVLTIDNCEELASILSRDAEYESYSIFADKYYGSTIEFDGGIDYVDNHGKYKTRYDILVSAGDYDPDGQLGPTFKFENVGVSNLNLDTLFLEDEIKVGKNVRIVAKVGEFNMDTGLFFLDPVSVSAR
ncbi:MAG: DUF4839 domain-containing protein [Lachnospiraceae bacterium]|nr:DUF4839 domain-containing protein [Lachnospiraceae bacterium]